MPHPRPILGVSAASVLTLAISACGRDLYDPTLDAARPPTDANRPGADARGAPTCDLAAGFGAPARVHAGPRDAFVSTPSLSPEGLVLRFLQGGVLMEQSRPNLTAPFSAATSTDLLDGVGDDLQSYFFREDGLERFIALGAPADPMGSDLFVQRRARTSDPWSALQPLDAVEPINTAADEWDPFLSVDGLTLWMQRQSASEIRMYRTHRADLGASFGTLEPLDLSASGDNPGTPSLLADGSAVVFSSADAIWFAPIDPRGGVGAPNVLVESTADLRQFEPFVRPDGCELFWVRSSDGLAYEVVRAISVP